MICRSAAIRICCGVFPASIGTTIPFQRVSAPGPTPRVSGPVTRTNPAWASEGDGDAGRGSDAGTPRVGSEGGSATGGGKDDEISESPAIVFQSLIEECSGLLRRS